MPFNRRQQIYIAGPMTDYPDKNFPAFFSAQYDLNRAGYDTCNPAELEGDLTIPWDAALARDLPELMQCAGVALLDGWEESKGARLEVAHALLTPHMQVLTVEEWIARARYHSGS